MKKIKRMTAMLMAIIALSGCSQKNSGQSQGIGGQDKTVQFVLWGGESDQELLNEMADSFKENYADQAWFEITVEIQDEAGCKDRILSDVSSAADVFAFADDQLAELAAAGVIEEIEAADKIKEENIEGAVEAASINEKLYAYPMTADNGYFMYYNKKYFTSEDVQSLDQMLKAAALNQKKVTMDWTSGWYLFAFFGESGLELKLNPDGITNDCNWNSKTGAVKGADIGNAMLAIAKNPAFASVWDEDFMTGVKEGSIIAGVSGIWNAEALKKIWGDDFAAAKLPTYTCAGKEVQLASFAGYKMVGVNGYSENKEWAVKLAEWLTNEENQILRFQKRGAGPSNIKAAGAEEVKKSPAIQALIAQSEFACIQNVGPNYWVPVTTFGEELISGTATAEKMQELMDAMVKGITMKITD